MHIVSVELENIKRYVHDRFEFMLGTNAISGPNGAGKSTILEAIGFALFDSLPYKKEDFLKRGASVGTVRVTFESGVDQRDYTVVRNTRSTYYVYDPETKTRVAEQKADVLSWLCEHLGVEPGTDLDELFRTTIGVPQGTFTAVFMDTATRRKAVFDKILRVEEYRQSSDALKETGHHLNSLIVEADKQLAVYNDRLLKMPDLLVQEAQLETERLSADKRLGSGRKELAQWLENLAAYDALEKAIAQDARDLEALEAKLGFAAKERAAASQRVKEAQEAADERKALEAPFHAYQTAEQELSLLANDLKTRDGLRSERSGIQRRLDEATFALETLKAQLASLEADEREREALGPKLAAQEAQEKLVAELKGQLTEARAVEERLTRTRAEHATWSERFEALSAELVALDKLADAPRLARSLEASLSEKQDLLKGLQAAELRHKELEHRRKLLEEASSQQQRAIAEQRKAIAAKEPLLKLADMLDALTEEGQALRDRLSAIEAEITRDKKAALQFNGNLCPILNVGCPILEGQSPEDYYREQIAANEAKAKALNDELLALRKRWKEASDASKQVAALEGMRQQLADGTAALAKHQEDLAALRVEAAQIPVTGGRIAPLEAALQEERAALTQAQADAARYAQREGLAQQRTAIEKEQAERSARLASDEDSLRKHAGLGDRLRAAEETLAGLGDPRSRDLALERAIRQRPQLEGDQAQKAAIAQAAKTELAALDERLMPFQDLDARLEKATTARLAAEPGYRRYLTVSVLATELESRLKTQAEAEAAVALLEADHEKVASAAKEREATYQADAHGALRERVEGLKAELIRLEQALGFLGQQLQATRREMADLTRVQEQMADAIAARERLGAHAVFLDFARGTLKEAGPHVTEAYLLNISIEADRLFREITGHPHAHLRWSNDYEIQLEEEGRPRPFANLSGGEQMAAALAVRLALLKETSNIDVAFFDEPTTNMDESRRANLALQIGEIKTFKQLFVISHDDSFEQWTDHVVRVDAQR